jgi:hypothetical protein
VEFVNEWDKVRVLEGRPWVLEDNLIAVEDYDGLIPPTQMGFDTAAFWIRMFDLPLDCMSNDVGQKLGETVGEVEDVDTNADGVGWGKFLRVRIRINLYKPLARGRMLRIKDRSYWIPFQYERLPRICFHCGRICHKQIRCPEGGERRIHGEAKNKEFGPWLRVPLPNSWSEKGRGRGSGERRYGDEYTRRWTSGAEQRTTRSNGANSRRGSWENSGFHGASMKGDMHSNGYSHDGEFAHFGNDVIKEARNEMAGMGNGAEGNTEVNSQLNAGDLFPSGNNDKSNEAPSKEGMGNGANGVIMSDMISKEGSNESIMPEGPTHAGGNNEVRKGQSELDPNASTRGGKGGSMQGGQEHVLEGKKSKIAALFHQGLNVQSQVIDAPRHVEKKGWVRKEGGKRYGGNSTSSLLGRRKADVDAETNGDVIVRKKGKVPMDGKVDAKEKLAVADFQPRQSL